MDKQLPILGQSSPVFSTGEEDASEDASSSLLALTAKTPLSEEEAQEAISRPSHPSSSEEVASSSLLSLTEETPLSGGAQGGKPVEPVEELSVPGLFDLDGNFNSDGLFNPTEVKNLLAQKFPFLLSLLGDQLVYRLHPPRFADRVLSFSMFISDFSLHLREGFEQPGLPPALAFISLERHYRGFREKNLRSVRSSFFLGQNALSLMSRGHKKDEVLKTANVAELTIVMFRCYLAARYRMCSKIGTLDTSFFNKRWKESKKCMAAIQKFRAGELTTGTLFVALGIY